MDFYKDPIGFGMALAQNTAALSESQKQDFLNEAHNARSEKEMHEIVNRITETKMR